VDTKTKAETVLGVGIISYNTADLLRQCLQSLIETNHVPHEHIVVVDSCSTDTTHEMMHTEYPSITLHILKENKGYAYAVNVAASLLDSEYMLLINADTRFLPDSIRLLVHSAQTLPDGGVWGMQQLYHDYSWQRSYGSFPSLKHTFADGLFLVTLYRKWLALRHTFLRPTKPFPVQYVDGAVMLIRKSVFDELHGFDERYFFYGEETDFCRRVQAQAHRKCYIVPTTTVIHYRGKSSQNSGGANEFYLKNLFSGMLRCASQYSSYKTLVKIQHWEITFAHLKSVLFKLLFLITKKDIFHKKYLYYKTSKEIWLSLRPFIDELCLTQ
jgi:GT2 family glycosyltransferase